MENVKIWVEGLNKDENKPIAFFKPLGQEEGLKKGWVKMILCL